MDVLNRAEDIGEEIVLSIDGLSKRYYKTKKTTFALKDISFRVRQGEIVGLLGANGAGKTTIIKCLTGLVKYDSGEITLNSFKIPEQQKHALNDVAIVLEGNRNLYWRLTVMENIRYFLSLRKMGKPDEKSIDEMLKRVSLHNDKHTLVEKLSRGMQQKLNIAIALLCKAKLIILDEPTLGLDIIANHEIVKLLQEIKLQENSILVASHDMSLIESIVDRVVLIKNGGMLVDTDVKSLRQLFTSTAYRMCVENKHNTTLQRIIDDITSKYGSIVIDGTNENTWQFIINIYDKSSRENAIELMSYFLANDIDIEKFERETPDFQHIVSRLLSRELES